MAESLIFGVGIQMIDRSDSCASRTAAAEPGASDSMSPNLRRHGTLTRRESAQRREIVISSSSFHWLFPVSRVGRKGSILDTLNSTGARAVVELGGIVLSRLARLFWRGRHTSSAWASVQSPPSWRHCQLLHCRWHVGCTASGFSNASLAISLYIPSRHQSRFNRLALPSWLHSMGHEVHSRRASL